MNDIAKSWEYQLFVKFLKKHKRYNLFVVFKNTSRFGKTKFADFLRTNTRSTYGIADLVIDFYYIVLKGDANREERLVTSQLWRFHMLEKLNEIDENTTKLFFPKENYVKSIRGRISHNGTRNSKEIEKLFDKFDILIF